jgi:transcription antitermination factor NusG
MQIPSIDRDWFVVRTKPGCEALAADELRIGGHETYLPRRRIKNFIRRQRLLTDQTRPLLPGYLFLATPEGRTVDWAHILHDVAFRHVGKPLRGLLGPLRVPGAIVCQIHVDEVAGKFDETGATRKANHSKLEERFAEGNEFRIIEGPFASFMAVSEGVTASDRVIALVSIFGRLARAEFSAEQLEEVA